MGLLRDDKRREEMGRKGRDWIIKNHSAEELLKVVEALNRSLVNE